MAPIIDVNFGDVPDKTVCVPPATYLCLIEQAPEIEIREGKGVMVKTVLTITDECESKGRKLFTNACLWVELGRIQLKQMALSAGIDASGQINTDDFLGQIVKAVVVNKQYTPEGETESQTVCNIKNFVPAPPEGADEADLE